MNINILKLFASILLGLAAASLSVADVSQQPRRPFPSPEKLDYRIEWRLITAGTAQINLARTGSNWETKLDLESAGMVTKLYRVTDKYRVLTNDSFCGINASLDAQEGKRHRISTLNFDSGKRKLHYEERDLIKNEVNSRVIDTAPCTHDVLGALAKLRQMHLEVGKTAWLPITNGKKTVTARIEAQAKETIKIDEGTFDTIRYEAFLFDNVLYQRKGELWIWMSNDASRLPVQIRVRMGFPVGTISLTLEKVQPG